MGDEAFSGTLEPGDFVYLRLSEADSELPGGNPFRDTIALLLGAGTAPALEQQLVGERVGDRGWVELVPTDDESFRVTRPAALDEVLQEDVATLLEQTGIDTARAFVEAESETLSDPFPFDPERIHMLQDDVRNQLRERRHIEYEITDAYRWQEQNDDDPPEPLANRSCDTTPNAGDRTPRLSHAERRELREQMVDAFKGADYPIDSPMDLVPALPSGPSTKFEAGDFSMTAMELNTKLGSGNFPYDSADAFVDDIFEQLEEQNVI